MNWKPGDIAIYHNPHSRVHGWEVEILTPLRLVNPRSQGGPVMGHEFDPGIPPLSKYRGWSNIPEAFKPLPPANKVTEWKDCVFKPKELLVVSE